MIARSSRSTLSPVAADSGTISANVRQLLIPVDDRQQPRLPDQIDLVEDQEHRRLRLLDQVEHEPIALARRLGRVDDQPEHVHLAASCRRPRRPSARSSGAAGGGCRACRETRPARPGSSSRRGSASASSAACRRRWRAWCRPAGSAASTCRRSGRPTNETKPDFIDRLPTRRPRASRRRPADGGVIRTLLIRRRSASSTSTLQPVDLEPLADRRHAAEVGQQKAADGLESLALDLDVQPLRRLRRCRPCR